MKVWRCLPSQNDNQNKPNPFDSRFLYSSKNRWTRENAYQTLYTSLDKTTAIQEHIKQWTRRPIMFWKNFDVISFEVNIYPIIDLTHPRVRGRHLYNITKDQMTGDEESDYLACKTTAELIQAQYPALKAFSAANDSGENLIIFEPTLQTNAYELGDIQTTEHITFDLIKKHTMNYEY